jgi:hypothetical protein
MTAMILPEIVQLPFGLGNLMSPWVVSNPGPAGPAATEDIEMFARNGVFSSIGRAAVMATVAAVALTAFEPSAARAGSAPAENGLTTAATGDATDFSARRRHYRRGGGAAAAAAFAAIVGTGIAIAASQNRRHYYYDHGPAYYYGGGPVYYGGPRHYRSRPYYGGQRYYGGYPSNHYGRGGAFDTLTPQHTPPPP